MRAKHGAAWTLEQAVYELPDFANQMCMSTIHVIGR